MPTAQSEPGGCTILSAPLRQLNQWLSNPMGKQKFLNATEEAFRRHPGLCASGARMLDVGAGGGEYTHWLGTRCSFCVKAYEVHNESSLPYKIMVGLKQGKSSQAQLAREISKALPVALFDGRRLPSEKPDSFHVVVFNSVLHHAAENACELLVEARRVVHADGYMLVFEDLAVPGNRAVARRQHTHDKKGLFRTQVTWSAMMGRAGWNVSDFGMVGSRALSRRHSGVGRLDYLYQRYFVLRPATPRPLEHCTTGANWSSEELGTQRG